jgi:hypothetical protein
MGAAAARAEPDDQDGLFDQVIQNDVLAQALEKREKARLAKAKATKTYTEAHEAAKGQIDALGLDAETVVRCGRFRSASRSVPARRCRSTRATRPRWPSHRWSSRPLHPAGRAGLLAGGVRSDGAWRPAAAV